MAAESQICRYRRVSLLPGLRVNLSKSGASLSTAAVESLADGRPPRPAGDLGLPGTGLYWTEYHPTARPVHHGHRLAFAVVVAALVAAIWWPAIA